MTQTEAKPEPLASSLQDLSMFVPSDAPRRRGLVIAISSFIGFLLTVVWSAEFVDSVIGDNVANTLLGHDAKATPIAGMAAGIAFAFASGIAGTFTACNIAAFGAVAPLVGGEAKSRSARLLALLKPLGWMSVGMITVSALYGALVAIVGTGMPQFSTTSTPGQVSPRLLQAMIVFGIIGVVLIYLGLASLRVVPDPLAKLSKRFPYAPMVVMGVLIGGFLIGRPFPLFRKMFVDAAESHNVLYGASAFVLQSLGNIVIMTVLFLILMYVTRGRVREWLTAKPARLGAVIGGSFLVVGVFTVLYWDVRLLSRFDILISWYPLAPWV